MSKVIFLDIDGVLNTKWWYTQMDRNTPKDKYGYAFDPRSVANLQKIVDVTGADIVISSSWKSFGLSELEEMWQDRGLPGKLIGITPNSVSDEMLLNADLDHIELFHIRGMEIKEWLDKHGKKVSHYVIIDDMDNFLPDQQPYFVQTNPEVGITEEDKDIIVTILNGKTTPSSRKVVEDDEFPGVGYTIDLYPCEANPYYTSKVEIEQICKLRFPNYVVKECKESLKRPDGWYMGKAIIEFDCIIDEIVLNQLKSDARQQHMRWRKYRPGEHLIQILNPRSNENGSYWAVIIKDNSNIGEIKYRTAYFTRS
jgi:hypothetical protein